MTVSPDPVDLLLALITKVEGIDVKNGILKSLDAKLAAALQALTDVVDGNNGAAIGTLGAFINFVLAQSGNMISGDDATCLVTDAQEIIDLLSK